MTMRLKEQAVLIASGDSLVGRDEQLNNILDSYPYVPIHVRVSSALSSVGSGRPL